MGVAGLASGCAPPAAAASLCHNPTARLRTSYASLWHHCFLPLYAMLEATPLDVLSHHSELTRTHHFEAALQSELDSSTPVPEAILAHFHAACLAAATKLTWGKKKG
eukprot:1624106-Amphidinium_carterae.2